eukprot:1969878-Pleurochrysis_carterae.AAC.1
MLTRPAGRRRLWEAAFLRRRDATRTLAGVAGGADAAVACAFASKHFAFANAFAVSSLAIGVLGAIEVSSSAVGASATDGVMDECGHRSTPRERAKSASKQAVLMKWMAE